MAAARRAGVELLPISGHRSFRRQAAIWAGKVLDYRARGLDVEKSAERAMQFTAIPGTSRHHWGTDVDIVGATPVDHFYRLEHFAPGGVFEEAVGWLAAEAPAFGYLEAYTSDPLRSGFSAEPWHYSFAELSVSDLRAFLYIPLGNFLRASDIVGREALTDAYLDRYRSEHVLGIHPGLKPVG